MDGERSYEGSERAYMVPSEHIGSRTSIYDFERAYGFPDRAYMVMSEHIPDRAYMILSEHMGSQTEHIWF